MIGLLDYDIQQSTSTSKIIPNLEIMKLATYYKIEENKFCRLLTLDEQDLDNYEKIYFFSEVGKKLLVPEQYLRAKNVIYGGTAFTNGKYIPFENEIIDYTIPRISIYKDFLKKKYDEGVKTKVISQVLDNTYYRCYAGDNKLPIPPVLPRKRVYLYDRDFFYPDWKETLEKISNRKPCGIYRIHPIFCHTLTEFFEVRAFDKLAKTNEIILDLNVGIEEIPYMIKQYKNKFLEHIVPTSNICLPLKSCWITREQYAKELIYTLNLLYSFWAHNIPVKIYFMEPKIGVKNPIYDLEKAVSAWTSSIDNKQGRKRVFSTRLKHNKVLKEQFEIIYEKYPSIKSLINQSYDELVKRRYWRI